MPDQPRRWTRHLSFANTCSFLALFVALSTGTAYAANTIRSGDIVDGQVRTQDLGRGSVTTAKIRAEAVRSSDVATGAVGSRAVRPDSLTAADLAPDSVGGSEIGPGGVSGEEVADGSLTAADLGSGSVTGSELADGSVTGTDVANRSLTFSDIVGGVSTGSVSVGAGLVPAGRCESFSILVSGASTGDAVVFSVQELMQEGVFFYGTQVTATNTVRTLLCNLSGTTQAAITDVQVRILTFR